jgi:hypothetical protein
MRRGARIAVLAFALAAWLPAAAAASWSSLGSGRGYSKAQALSSGSVPTATASVRSVTVSWTASGGSVPVAGYAVKRYDTNGISQMVGSGCSGTIAALTCTEQAVPGGQWRYTVTPLNNNWRGAESGQSTAVTVASPSMTLSPSTVTSLPSTLTGQIAAFLSGQTVSFRLDNATTGTVLTGSITPTPVPSSGTSSVSVTIPAGTANGAHTVYAIGSAGDVASAAVTVSAPVTSTIGASAWDVRDASGGAGEVVQSDTSAFANDSRAATSGAFASSFSTSRYVQYTFNGPLAAESATSSVAFNLNFAGTVAGETTCFYFDVRRASTGTVIGTHGSAAAPVDCTTATSFKATSTSLPEVVKGEVANDLQVRVYATSSGAHPLNVDLATVSGTSSGQAFGLYETSFVDSATGTAAAAVPWSLSGSDSAFYASAGSWATAFASTRYLKLSFPSYVPAAAALNGATFKHSYRSANAGASVCYYFEVYSGASLIGTHGTAAAPVSCTSSSTVWQTDSVALPEVTSVAAANAISIKLYVNRSTAGKSRHDLAELAITYTK